MVIAHMFIKTLRHLGILLSCITIGNFTLPPPLVDKLLNEFGNQCKSYVLQFVILALVEASRSVKLF